MAASIKSTSRVRLLLAAGLEVLDAALATAKYSGLAAGQSSMLAHQNHVALEVLCRGAHLIADGRNSAVVPGLDFL